MKQKISRLSAVPILLLLLATPLLINAEDKTLSEKEKIESLIKRLENLKDAKFIRNDTAYDSKAAARFLRGKWELHDNKIKTATDFIEKVGSISSTSGKPYVIRFKDGGETKCGSYLKEELKKLEKGVSPNIAHLSPSDALPERRSAELHSAVSTICNRQSAEMFQRVRTVGGPQNAILRYEWSVDSSSRSDV